MSCDEEELCCCGGAMAMAMASEEESRVIQCVESMAMIANSQGFDDLMKLAAVAAAQMRLESAACCSPSKMLRPDASCKRRRTPRRCSSSDRVSRIVRVLKKQDVEHNASCKIGERISNIRKVASKILKLLDENSFLTEKSIRLLVGNNPDTSKALRVLLKAEKIWRIGDGGKQCPYRYDVAKKGFRELKKN